MVDVPVGDEEDGDRMNGTCRYTCHNYVTHLDAVVRLRDKCSPLPLHLARTPLEARKNLAHGGEHHIVRPLHLLAIAHMVHMA